MPLPVPPELEEALAQVPSARAQFDRLPPEGKDEWIAWVARPRLAGARRRRIHYLLRTLGSRRATPAATEEPGPPPPLPPGAAWWPWLLALALLLLVAALLVWLLLYRGDDNGGRTVIRKGTVPNFVGEKLQQARRQAQQADVTLEVERRVAAHPQGTIVDQQPVPGTLVRSGAPVTVVVSRGPAKRAVPDVTGLGAPEAAARVQKAGFLPKLVQVASARTAGTVLAQKPKPEARAKPGTKVVLTVAKGAPATTAATTGTGATQTQTQTAATQTATATTSTATTPASPPQPPGVAVPGLVGQGLATALRSLEQLGLLATVKMQSSQAPVGQVRGQNPAAGRRVPPGTRVQVNVAEGPNPGNPTPIPDVAGEDEDTATSDLEDAGFQVVVVQTSRGSGATGTVVEQQPAAGRTIASGDLVAIYVRR